MNILLITKIYPAFLDQSRLEISYAVHSFAKEWTKNNKVQVIRVYTTYPKPFCLINKFRLNKMVENSQSEFIQDGVVVNRINIKKSPGLDYSETEINKFSEKVIDSLKENFSPDLIICDILNPSIYIGKKISEKFGSKLVASLHNSDIFYLKRKRYLQKYKGIENQIDKIFFRSDNIEKHYLKLFKSDFSSRKNSNVLFGIDSGEMISSKKFNDKKTKKIKEIIVVCSLIKLKNVAIIIEAFSLLNKNEKFLLRIIGDGPERNNLKKLTAELKCNNSIIFEGAKEHNEVLNFMEHADVFVLLSSPETFGLVYIEAMAKGCVTIGSKGEGIDGVIENNENGFLCDHRSSIELKVLLEKISLMNYAEKSRIMENARETVISMTNEKLSEKFLSEVQN